MELETKQTLQLLVDQAHKLKDFKLDEHLRKVSRDLRGRIVESDLLKISLPLPGEKEREAFLQTLRTFIQKNDKISLARINELLADRSLSDELRQGIETISRGFTEFLDSYSIDAIKILDGFPTRGQILETVLSVGLGNTNTLNRIERFKQWTRDSMHTTLLSQEFASILLEIYAFINYLADLSEKELAANSPS